MKVAKVNTLNRRGKRKRNRRTFTYGKRPDTKRAIVTLVEGDTIDLFQDCEIPGVRTPDGTPQAQAHQPGTPVPDGRRLLRAHPRQPRALAVDKKSRTGGRNVHGRKTARRRGGGHKQRYRIIDFRRNKDGVPAKVAAIEYDPNRSCRIAAALPGRREALHPGAPRRGGRRPAPVRPGLRDPAGQRPAAALHPGRHHRPQRRAQARRRAARWPARPARRWYCWPRRATTSPCAWRRPRCAGCRSTAGPRSARSATPSTS